MQNTRFCANKSGIAGAIPLAYPKSRSFSRPQARIKCKSVLSGGVYIGQNTLRTASVEFVRKQRTNYARRRAQPFRTRTQPRGSRLRACQKDFLTSSKEDAEASSFKGCGLVLVDGDDNAGANGTAALADSEAEILLDGDRGDQLDLHVDVITRHAHLNALGQSDDAGNVSGSEVELRTIVVEERGVTAAFVLGQNVDLANELGVRMDGAGLRRNPSACGTFRCR